MNNEAVAANRRSMAVPEAIVAVSGGLLRVEHRAIQALMFLLSALILLNVVTRYTATRSTGSTNPRFTASFG